MAEKQLFTKHGTYALEAKELLDLRDFVRTPAFEILRKVVGFEREVAMSEMARATTWDGACRLQGMVQSLDILLARIERTAGSENRG